MKKLIFILLFIPSVIFGQSTYYVSKTGGNAGHAGSFVDPWLTLSYAESQIMSGDTVKIMAGTYTERLVILGISGTSSKRTVFMSYNGASVKIDGQNAGTDTEGDIVRIYDDYVDFYGFELQNANQDRGAGDSKGHCIDTRGDNITISYCKIHDALLNGVTSNFGDSIIIEYNEIYNCSLVNENGNSPTGYWGAAAIITGPSGGGSVSYPIFRGNLIHDIWGEGPTVRHTKYALFEDNVIYNCFSALLYVQNTRWAKVQRNLSYMTKDMSGTYSGASVGIAIWDESYDEPRASRVTVINNLVYGCERNLMITSADTMAIIGNTFVNSTHAQMNVELGMGEANMIGYFANNIIDENDGTAPTNIIFVQGADYDHITFFNNSYSRALSTEYELRASGVDDVIGDPLLLKTGGTGAGELSLLYFKLDALSPVIDQGKDLDGLLGIYYDTTGVSQDYEQFSRDITPDIGAWEYDGVPIVPAIPPTVMTSPSVIYTAVTANVTGIISSDGGGTLTVRGVCWSTSTNPTTSDNHTEYTASIGTFTDIAWRLKGGTTYHVRAYATNESGTSYGADVSFTTPIHSIGISDGKIAVSGGKTGIVH